MTPIKPMHPSLLKTNARKPENMSVATLPPDMRQMVETEALAIFADMSNAGCSLQQTLAAVFLSGMSAANAAVRGSKVTDEQPPKVCPECGSEEVSIICQEKNGEIVCAADSCLECGHQWNVG